MRTAATGASGAGRLTAPQAPGRPGRAAATRQALLASARQVFTASGFAESSIADVVAGAGASVGSLYHHFGGKGELYLALFEDHQQRQEARAATAVRVERARGEREPVRLFLAGSRAYLDGCWAERDLARLFLAGGGPVGFELVARRRYREWTARNAVLLVHGDSGHSGGHDGGHDGDRDLNGDGDGGRGSDDGRGEPWGDALVLVLTTVVSEAGHEVAVCESETAARRLAGDVLALIGRIGQAPGPSQPDVPARPTGPP